MAPRRDFYEVLGVPRTATASEIQSAYRKLARTYHPDVNKDPEADARFKEIAEAYDVLSDPDTRRRYDAFGHDFRQVPEDMDPETWARVRSGASAGGPRRGRPGGGGGEGVWFSSGGDDVDIDIDIDSIFGDLFGGRARTSRGPWGRSGPIPGADQEAEIEVTLEEAYNGTRRTLTVTGPDGPRTIDVNIPAGVTDGQRIRLAGQGSPGSGGARPGDLYLIVRLAPHRRYRVEGRNISVDLPVAPWEAALGATVDVHTPGGTAKVRVPAGSSSGRRLRMKGRGLPNPRRSPGDLYAEVRIVVPHTLSDDERRLFEELSKVSTFEPQETPMTTAHVSPPPAPLARPVRLDLESFALACGLHPDLVRRLVALGLLDATSDAGGELWFRPSQLAAAARLQRLRSGLSLNYAALGVVVDLLDRIDRLETALRRPQPANGGIPWTRTG